MRARDAWSAWSWAIASARNASFSTDSFAADPSARASSGSFTSAGSCSTSASGRPLRAIRATARLGARRIGGTAVGVDQPARAAPRIQHLDARVAERRGKRFAQLSWPRRLSQVTGEASQARACARDAHEAPGEPEREQGVRDRPGEEDRGEPGPVRILERRSQERDRIGRLGRADQERWAEDREQRPAARACCSSSRRQAKATRPSAIASADQSNRSPSALAIPASAWTRNELSVQLRQQYRSSSGSRNTARPTVRRATSTYAATTATRAAENARARRERRARGGRRTRA